VKTLIIVVVVVVVLIALGLALSVRIVKQYEQGVLFRLGRVVGARPPGLRVIVPFVDVLHRVSLRIVTMPIRSQGIINPRQRQRGCVRGGLLPGRGRSQVRRRDRERLHRDRPDCPDHAAQSCRPAHPRPDAVGDRQDQPGHPQDPGCHHGRVGRRGDAAAPSATTLLNDSAI
jgi:SPFH domain / Band 7 family